MICHNDENLVMKRNGKNISLYVNQKKIKSSVHNFLSCTDCHIYYNPHQIPHNPQNNTVNCFLCHSDIKQDQENVHRNVKCESCHNYHYVDFAKNLSVNENEYCLNCHRKKEIISFKTSIHSKRSVKCSDCHNSGHKVLFLKNKDNTQICGKCHLKSKKEFNNSIHKMVLNSGNKNAPDCVDCHGVHKTIASKMSIESQKCLKCHLDENLFPGEEKGSAKFVSNYKTSVHFSIQKQGIEPAGCVDCHGNHMIQPEINTDESTKLAKMIETCGKCHYNIVAEFKSSQHGIELTNNNPNAPTCTTCHGEHDIKSTVTSSEFSKINQAEICLKCHNNQKLSNKNFKGEDVFVSDYKNSYHYTALKEGKNSAACSDCHGSHQMKIFNDVNSLIYEKNIQNTCGQSDCHFEQLTQYRGSIHERAITEKLNFDSPSCTDCHTSHQIMKISDNQNYISSGKGTIQLCSSCHSSVELIKNNNLQMGKVESYMNSYHGLAVRWGSKYAADCGSCHHYHNIRHSTDTLSTIHKNNLSKTCGNCHHGVEKSLLNTKIHLSENYEESPVLFWIRKIYIILISSIIGLMLLHNTLDLIKKLKIRKAKIN